MSGCLVNQLVAPLANEKAISLIGLPAAPALVNNLVKASWGSLPADPVEEAVGASGWPPAAPPDPSAGVMAVPEDSWRGDMATNITTLGKGGLNGAGLNGAGPWWHPAHPHPHPPP